MISPSDMGSEPVADETARAASPAGPSTPANWREALMGLIASRAALIELEAKEAAKSGARRAVMVGIAAGCLFFTWALLLAGVIGLIATQVGWGWHWVALGAAGLHLIAAVVLMKQAKPSGVPAFPVTRSEFQKDREWIENFQKTKSSNG